MTRIRTLNFLPEIFQTKTNTEFLSATLDQLVNPPVTKKIQGYIGSKVGYGVNANDYYVTEPTKTRTDYQLDPGVVFTKTNQSTAQDFISYPGMLDALALQGGITDNNSRLFESQIYSWDSFTDLDKIANYNQYYWIPNGPPAVTVSSALVYSTNEYIVTDLANAYDIKELGSATGSTNPTITLLRGGEYQFIVDQDTQFWIQGEPGVTGFSLTQTNLPVRDVYGVTNNGATQGIVTFTVPSKNAQDEYLFPGNNLVSLVSTIPYATLNGSTLTSIGSIDGITSVNGLTVMFYDTNEPAASQYFYQISVVNDVIALAQGALIPTNEKITALYGTTWINREFYRNTSGVISLVPYITAPLDQLYYQDGTSANKVGIIRIIESNTTNTINVETDILGRKNYTSTNGVVFTNGLKVEFDGDVIPVGYLSGEYYVEGVGSAIELIPVETLVSPEGFTTGTYIPFDTTSFDISNFDSDLFVPTDVDYITIARNAINKNAWSRSNRWFHSQVINQTAVYNNNPSIVTEFARAQYKARRPIIEFYPNLKLFNSGTIGKESVDFIDQRTTDALSQIAGLNNYFPDVEVYTANTASISAVSTSPVAATAFIVGSSYKISTLGTTNWNTVAGTTGLTYALNDIIQCAVVGTGTGAGISVSTTITVPTTDIVGTFQLGQYISDYLDVLPNNTQITTITIAGSNTVLTVAWAVSQTVSSATNVAVIATDTTVNNYSVFDGARIIFAQDSDINVKNKIYVVAFSQLTPAATPVITLTEAQDGLCVENDQTVILRGYNNQGNTYYFNDVDWEAAQEKVTVNQAPLFDVFDENGISFSDPGSYQGTSFAGSTLFSYGLGSGTDDPILGFPIRYSAVNNVGDISFDVSLNTDTFDYVTGTTPITQKINTGYVFNYDDRTVYTRELGWQTAIAPSAQYQVFQFTYLKDDPSTTFVCDIAAIPEVEGQDSWTSVQVTINNTCQCASDYSYTTTSNSTIIELLNASELDTDTPIEVLILSNQISNEAYYTIPVNLGNNPLNQDLETVNVGDIRLQYRDIYANAPGMIGQLFGANNYRDLGNLVPYGTNIIQNSASLVLPGTFLRKTNHNLFDALQFNSNEYIKFKNLLVDTINNAEYVQRYTPSEILNQAIDIITAAKSESQAFFWSDMLPAKAPLRSNTYTFANNLDTSIYSLTTTYNFATANYNSVLVYLTRTISGVTIQKQLVANQDYIISQDAPSVTVTLDLIAGDKITINEYNQTYGSYVPNTPTKLGLYPAYVPEVVLDTAYSQPTYFIKGHDGSYNKLYGSYNTVLGVLEDFRDQGLFEFELRIYNNLKLSSTVPIQAYEILPGFFRDTDYTYSEFLQMYSEGFLNWVGQNRLNYKTQYFNKTNEFTYNYTNAANKLTNTAIEQGYWRGVYQYFYDTTTPNATPWEMLGFTDQPTWWLGRYGPAPYTSDNLVLWTDLEQGIIWNNGNPVTVDALARPGLTSILPVDSAGNLVSTFVSIVGNYNPNTFQRDWKVGDNAPVELSYRRSSSYPFDLMRIFALMKPANFFNLGVDLDNYKYNAEFNQYLVNNRSHLVISDVEIYGSGTAKTSYINWIVDYEKQQGINATQNITNLLDNLDVRLVYRLAGYSDKNLLKFYVEKGTPNSRNASLLIPDESYSLLLYDNQPFDRIVYSGVVVQITQDGYTVFGNSQTNAYFKVLKPLNNGKYNNIQIEDAQVKVAVDYTSNELLVPYGNKFYSEQEVAQFLSSYGAYLTSQGMIFNDILGGIEINWDQMINEFLYWSQTGWEVGSIVLLNPSAQTLKIDKESAVVQPLTVQNTNFILNQNLYPIQTKDMSVSRNGTEFGVTALNQGDSIAYGQFNVSNFEHAVVFDNTTLFNDTIYNLVTGLRQNRIYLRGTKTAEWNGTVTASGFILNQDNIQEWTRAVKYTKGAIVLYKNKYWTALKVIEPSNVFGERDWKETDYDQIQKGLLPNSSTRSYESALYYDTNKANLENDADLLGFSLIGYRPRDYMALVDLTDITQINVYQNLIKNKGTRNAVEAFRGATLPQGGIEYEVYENWAIKSGEYGGLLNKNFVDFRINEQYLTGNPAIVSLTNGIYTPGSQQEVPIYSLFNYSRPIETPDILSTIDPSTPSRVFPDAGYVNFNDVKMSSYFYSGLPVARDKNNEPVLINDFYVRDYAWLANYLGNWDVLAWASIGRVIAVRSNLNNTATITFAQPHGLSRLQPLSIINYATNVDGYYIVANVVNLNEVIINLPVATEIASTGQGIGLTFQSQRVSKPSDINELPLLDTEFVKNTVWVDESTDGSWAVYRKSLNYQYNDEVTKTSSTTFGSAVAYTDQAGYLISDASLGEVYRYAKNSSNAYTVVETLTGGASFGSQIAYAGSTYVISEPTGSPEVHVYVINDSQLSDDFLFCQTISAPVGVTNWGSEVSISGDGNWLYISDIANNKVHTYRKQNILLNAGYFTATQTYIINDLGTEILATEIIIGQTYQITSIGSTDFIAIGAVSNEVGTVFTATSIGTGTGTVVGDFTSIGAIENKVGITFVATGVGTGTGTATQISYQASTIIDGVTLSLVSAGDNFSKSITTSYYGDTLVVGAPDKDYSGTISNWGSAYAFSRAVQNIEVQNNTIGNFAQTLTLAWSPTTVSRTVSATNATGNLITLNSTSDIAVNEPIIFSGTGLGGTGILGNSIYYIRSIVGSDITIKTSRSSSTAATVSTVGSVSNVTATIQTSPLYVYRNGVLVQDNNYGVIGSNLVYSGTLSAGDIITVSDSKFTYTQTFTSNYNDRVGTQFGYSVDTTQSGSEILVGSPFEINTNNQEGAAYRFTNAGAKFGLVTGVNVCTVTAVRPLLINGYLVNIPIGNATTAANTINFDPNIRNIQAAATVDNKLMIQVINNDLTQVNQELVITAVDTTTLGELGIQTYTNTQIITCPHVFGPTQFGSVVKFNEYDSVVISAPVATRYEGTTFDFIDDEDFTNDTIFDNNATQFVDTAPNAGAVYMFDYIANYNENLTNIGEFVYAQSVNSKDIEYGFNPLYGTALEFNSNVVMIGTPNFLPDSVDGQVTVYENETGIKDWSIYRSSAPVVDIESIQNAQLFSAETNNTLINLDYIDPLQGKLLGSVRQNINYVASIDPANYNSQEIFDPQSGLVWGPEKVGKVWFDTNNVRFVNYHQNDLIYNSKYWGTVFPGSDVAVYTWQVSNVPPRDYQGPGTPKDITRYTVSSILDSSNVVTPVYYFWVRNSNTIGREEGKTLSDTIIESYIRNPKNSGIAFFAPLRQNSFALYNCAEYLNANDSVFHVGYATGTNDDEAHAEYTLIKEDFADDFLPGLPKIGSNVVPYGLYDRMLDSLAGVDEEGSVVPNPFLPKAVQSGVLARPRQSFFYNRFLALKNYLTYANEILAQYPISEIRPDISFLFTQGEFYNTPDYWQYINWWAVGYDDNTKSAIQVPIYADLSTLVVTSGTIATVENNGSGRFEVYRYDGNSIWTRVGLQNGTIEFNLALWDYAEAKLGFGDNFFDTNPFDEYPSEETRYIIRALNEQIYIDELLLFRNKGLILLFEYIQSESTESQNYLPWLNKTSLVDVSHSIRELKPVEVFQTDNQEFLEGYINEVKPYHVVIKEFVFKYTGIDTFDGDITDFDLPAQYNSSVQQFITPSLVYSTPSENNEYLNTNDIWQTAPYTQWFQNKGLSLTGQPNYEITTLVSYMTFGSSFMFVDNIQGFPINGTIRIGDEEIAYSSVDRDLNLVSGLQRGINGTAIVQHFPNEKIFIDLPEVLVLNGGTGYIDPPKVTAYIDLALYPAPTTEAVLEAVMSLDSVLQINVINPGDGYMVLPEIRIEPSEVIPFTNTDINSILHTIAVYAPNLSTGDLVLFKESAAGVDLLENNQWYYVNVLETTPTAIVAFYSNYSDAINDTHRIQISDIGTDNELTISLGAKASAITSASPIRENNITLRFDRTTYNSQVQDWRAGVYYGSFFAGSYFNSENIASSSIQLESVLPDISTILASAQGVAFEISDVANDRQLTWSSLERVVGSTIAATNAVRLIPLDDGSANPNASGSTIGFYVNMPVKFVGAVAGGLQENTTYYVKTIIDDTDFTVSLTEGGGVVTLTNATISVAGLKCLVGEVVDTAVITVNYPGILEVTATQSGTNALTVPINLIGTGGTEGFYTNVPIFFTNSETGNVFGGVIENDVYYVTTVIDSQTFTMSETQDPLSTTATVTTASNDRVTVSSTAGFAVNDPIIFTGTTFGGITAGTTYYVSEVVSTTQITISLLINGGVFALSDSSGSALVTSQANTLALSTATGSMTMNVSLPASPGQVNGQLFTLYGTSGQYPDVSGTNGSLIERTMTSTTATLDRITIDSTTGTTDNFYVNMPVQFDTTVGGITAATTYYVTEIGTVEIDVTSTSVTGNSITCDTTGSLYVGMPIIFSGQGLGGIVIGVEYFVQSIIDSDEFTISDTAGGSQKTLASDSGTMAGTGSQYVTVSLTKGGAVIPLSNAVSNFTMTQEIITDAVFDVSYILGGYRAIVSTVGEGYAVNNTITILGANIGGATPTNNLTLTVNTIDTNGGITDVICSGIVAGTSEQYYLKVISPNQFEVYSNPLMTVPVSGIGFGFVGFTTTTATAVTASNDRITVTSSADFLLNDPVVFAGTMFSSQIILGQTYYIYDKPTSTTVRLTTGPGGAVINFTADTAGSMSMSKAGSFALLPEPFYFNQSVVKFNNRVYVCVVSNNDTDFIFGKWELLDSGDRRLNAMDRVIGYYQPTVNMPGVDLTQLFEGVTYPNSTYLGNPFAPDQQYEIDSILQTQEFYPTDIDVASVVWNGTNYLAAASIPNYSAVLGSSDGETWAVAKLTNAGIGLTDIIYANSIYVMSSTNSATPILRSNDGIVWTSTGIVTDANSYTLSGVQITGTAGQFSCAAASQSIVVGQTIVISGTLGGTGTISGYSSPTTYYIIATNGTTTFTLSTSSGGAAVTTTAGTPTGLTYALETQPISIAALSLHSVAYGGTLFVSVGEGIVSSTDTYAWTERLEFTGTLANTLYSVAYANVPAFTGFVAVGKGQIPDYSTGLTKIVDTDLIYYSTNGNTWTGVNTITSNGFNGVASDGTQIVTVGENGVIYYSENGSSWLGVNEVTVVSVNSATNELNVTNTAGFTVNDVVRFTDSFSSITTLVNSGSFVIGQTYVIDTIGTTNFTLIGASSNTIGVSFIATGVGTGTGTANSVYYIFNIVSSTQVQISGAPSYWNISVATFDAMFPVGSQDTAPTGLFFKPDGLKMYMCGSTDDDVYEYDLATAWDVTTASFLRNVSVSANPAAVFFRSDGLKMYITETSLERVVEYNLSTAWNISTRSTVQTLTVSVKSENPTGLWFKPDGLKMYISASAPDTVAEYDLSSAWNISTAVWLQSKSIFAQDDSPQDIFFKPDGLTMYMVGNTTGTIYEYTLSTAWNISTATVTSQKLITAQDTAPRGIFFKPDGTSMFLVGQTNDRVYQYTLSQLVLTSGSIPFRTRMYSYPATATLNDIAYGNGVFIAVGDNGTIRTSSNAIAWTTRTSGTTEKLNGITYKATGSFIAVGENDTVLLSDDYGVTWTASTLFVVAPPVYDIQGDAFTAGYAPEELVAGVITDNFTMIVNTRPGTNWLATEYAHTGYNVISLELTPVSATQTVYSFAGAAQYVTEIFVAVIDSSSGSSITLYEGTDYTIDWINDTVTLTTPIAFSPTTDKLRVDVYEVGNGDQLVKSNSKTDPIRLNTDTGFNEIYLNCNYSGVIYAGGGVIRPASYSVEVFATETDSSTDRILCDNVEDFVINSGIYFQGAVFGGIVENTQYYVKSISYATNTITISSSEISGVAGPVFALTDATGLMLVNIKIGSGLVWTDPIVTHNGTKLVLGHTNTAVQTKASNNAVVTVSTSELVVNSPITFSEDIFTGSNIDPLTTYYIKTIIDNNEFTISQTPGGTVKVLGNATGSSIYVTNDYAIGVAGNGISAKLVFAAPYDNSTDYLSYTLFGETFPVQYGYTVPETQLIVADGTVGPFALDNFVGGDNPSNAIVEVDGLRLSPSGDYTINSSFDTITFNSAPTNGSTIAVTTFNDTQQQYLNTQVITASSAQTVLAIQSISNEISLPLATTRATASTATTTVTAGSFVIGEAYTIVTIGTTDFTLIGASSNTIGVSFIATGSGTGTGTADTNKITVDSTTGFVVNATVQFKGTSFGGLSTTGTVYFVRSIVSGTAFTIQDENGNLIVTTAGTGNMQVVVGGQPAVRVTTAAANGLSENDLVTIDGTLGSVQLNNNTYYAKIIDSATFDLYESGIVGYTGYNPALGATNYPITGISSYTGGGYAWLADAYYLVTQVATNTTTSTNRITVTSTSQLVANTPVIFTGTVFGNLVEGTTYYIRQIISATQFTVSATHGGSEFTLTTASGSMNVTQWEQVNTDRLWVTVNGERVSSSSLRLNSDNRLSILTSINSGDTVIITSMMPYATPDEEVYLNFVNAANEASVYRANTGTRTWLTESMYDLSTVIYVDDVTRLTNTITQSAITPAAISGYYNFGLTADKNLITNVTVYNNSTNAFISSNNYQVVVEELSPILKITAGSYINVGDQLTITTLEGNLIYINGEQIRFGSIDLTNNTLGTLERGVNGTGRQTSVPVYSEVFGLLSKNRLSDVYYDQTWNSNIFNTVAGDPLQISQTVAAEFLNTDIL